MTSYVLSDARSRCHFKRGVFRIARGLEGTTTYRSNTKNRITVGTPCDLEVVSKGRRSMSTVEVSGWTTRGRLVGVPVITV